MIRRTLIAALLLGLTATQADSQPAGAPIQASVDHPVTVSASTGYVRALLNDLDTYSYRYLLRAIYRPHPVLSIYGEAGMAQLRVANAYPGMSEYDVTARFAHGAGVGITLPVAAPSRPDLFLKAGGFRFFSQGIVSEDVVIGGANWQHEMDIEYEWIEYLGAAGLIWKAKRASFYLGTQTVAYHRWETRSEAYRGAGQLTDVGQEVLIFEHAPHVLLLTGVDLSLPHRLRLSLEVRGRDTGDYGMFFALSQEGTP